MSADLSGEPTDPFPAACARGDLDFVRQELARSPALATAKFAPLDAEALVYVANSKHLRSNPDSAPRIVEGARLLLQHGANPNAFVTCGEGRHSYKLSVLYAASGRANNAALTRALLDAGADPNDNESLYHSTEFGNPACTRLLLERGAKIEGSNAVHRQLDYEDLEGLRTFFEFGANPNLGDHNGNPLIHHAITRGRSAAILAFLADEGADLKVRSAHGLTPFEAASLLGHTEAVQFLTQRGCAVELSPEAKFIAACAAGNAAEAAKFATKLSDRGSLALAEFAWRNNQRGVELLLAHGAPRFTLGLTGGTALHNACWMGNLPMVEILLRHNPPLELLDRVYNAPPLGWAIHGMHNSKDSQGRYNLPIANHPGVICALVAAGVKITDDQRQELKSILP
jgi:ankyrin repeat protein